MIGDTSLYVNGYDMATLGLVVGTWPGFLDSPRRRMAGQTLWGRDGEVLTTSESSAEPREVQVSGVVLQDTVAATRTAWNTIKQKLDQGLLEVVFGDEPTLRLNAFCVQATLRVSEGQRYTPGGQATISLLALDPYREAIEGSIVAFGAQPAQVPMGTGPSGGTIQLTGATNPVVTYRDQSGVIRGAMGLTVTLGANDFLTIDLSTSRITLSTAGVVTNGIGLLTAGTFFGLDARDSDAAAGAWPTLETSSGNATLLYRKRYA
jgi:hypothetical protein